MGVLSVEEIILKTKQYLESSDMPFAPISRKKKLTVISERIKKVLEPLLVGEEYNFNDLDEYEIGFVKDCADAVEVLGQEICLAAYLEPEYAAAVCTSLSDFSVPILYSINKCEEIQKLILVLPLEFV